MPNKSLPKLAGKDPPYKNRISLAPEVNLCSELAYSHVLWSVLLLNKFDVSLYAINCVFGSILCLRSPRTWLPVSTYNTHIANTNHAISRFPSQGMGVTYSYILPIIVSGQNCGNQTYRYISTYN